MVVVWRCLALLYQTEPWAWNTKSVERYRVSRLAVLKLELLEEWSVELKRLEGILATLGLEAPQRAQL